MIFAAITGNLELGTEPDDGAGMFGLGYGFFDLLCVAIEVHSPLVQIASSHFQQPHRTTTQTQTERGIFFEMECQFRELQGLFVVGVVKIAMRGEPFYIWYSYGLTMVFGFDSTMKLKTEKAKEIPTREALTIQFTHSRTLGRVILLLDFQPGTGLSTVKN